MTSWLRKKMDLLTDGVRGVGAELAGFSERRCLFWLSLLLFFLYIGALAYPELAGGDETRVAGISREMLLSSDYLMPRLNGEPFLEYPSLYYIGAAGSMALFGATGFAAKLPSALAAVFGALLLFRLLREMKATLPAACLSTIILATGAQYFGNGASCMVDSLLAMFCILSFLGFYRLLYRESGRNWSFLWLAVGLAGGLLTKNLPGLAIPLSGMGVFLLLDDLRFGRLRFRRYWLLGTAVLLSLAVYAAYVGWLAARHGDENESLVYTLAFKNNFGRFTGSYAEHDEPFFYYFRRLPELFQPWLIVLLFALPFHFRAAWRQRSSGSLYGLCLLLTPFLLLCLSAGKRQVYLLPLAAPAAMLAGTFLAALWRGEVVRLPEWVRPAVGRTIVAILPLAGLLTAAGTGIFGFLTGRPAWEAYWLPGALLTVSLLALWGLGRRRAEWMLPALALTFVLIYGNISMMVLVTDANRKSFGPMFFAIEQQWNPRGTFYLDQPPERISGAACFYLGRRVPRFTLSQHSISQLTPDDLVLTSEKRWRKLGLATEDWHIRKFNERYLLLQKKK